MPLTRLRLDNFTAFEHLELDFSPGINIFIGENATGKTHILKVLYAACRATKEDPDFAHKLRGVFGLESSNMDALFHRAPRPPGLLEIEVRYNRARLSVRLLRDGEDPVYDDGRDWPCLGVPSVFILAKEVLASTHGLRSVIDMIAPHVEETATDLLGLAYMPKQQRVDAPNVQGLLDRLRDHIGGDVTTDGSTFSVNEPGLPPLEFNLLAEGMRKIALLYLLLDKGEIRQNSVLFWDEPEANLNPSLVKIVVETLLDLQRMGVQVFVATHDFVTLKYFDLLGQSENMIRYHTLYRDEATDDIVPNSTDEYALIDPNAISDTYADLYDRDVRRALRVGQP